MNPAKPDEAPNALVTYFRSGGPILSYEGLARVVGVHPTKITRAVRGLISPKIKLALDIEVATQGAVTAAEFMEICAGAQAALAGRERPQPPAASSPELTPSAVV